MNGWSGRYPAISGIAYGSGALAVLALTLLVLVPAKPDPDHVWRSIQDDLKAGKLDRAEPAMGRLLRLRPATDEHWMVLGQIALARGRDAEALEHLARVSDDYPMAARARTWEGTIELKNQRARKAEAAFLQALRLDPHDTTARRELIRLYCIQRRRRELNKQFAALSRETVLNFNQMLLWSSSLATSWDPDEVRPMLEGFVKADPDDRTSRLVLAEALRRARRSDDVDAVLSRLPSSDPEVRAIRARIAFSRGDIAEVERLSRDHPDEHPVLARVSDADLALSRRDLPAARKHLSAALAADPRNRSVLYQLGDTLVKLGDVKEGRRYLAASRAHDSLYALFERLEEPGGRDDAPLLAAVAGASLGVGLRAEARAWYLLALERDPANPDVQKALYRLEHAQADSVAESADLHARDF